MLLLAGNAAPIFAQGFQVLVETEWLEFGHKFADRCGHGENSEDLNERCPVFLQWLDCVHQLQRQFPCSFEFNEAFLVRTSVGAGWKPDFGWSVARCFSLGVFVYEEKPIIPALLSFFISADTSPYMADCVCMNAGEAGAAHLLLSVWDLPVQQWQRESGPAHSGEDVFCVVTAETSQPQSEEHAVLFTL